MAEESPVKELKAQTLMELVDTFWAAYVDYKQSTYIVKKYIHSVGSDSSLGVPTFEARITRLRRCLEVHAFLEEKYTNELRGYDLPSETNIAVRAVRSLLPAILESEAGS